MKKVLVTGAAGVIGINVIKYLLSEGKYEITALDLRTKNSQKKLKKYRRRINIIYGDMNDNVLIEALVKDQDYIIHLASVLPPFADIKKNLCELMEYNGTENIVKAINYYNPNCFLIYASSTTIYGDKEEVDVNVKPNVTSIDYYSNNKIKTEKLLQKKVKNYTIFRVPLVLCDPKSGAFMYNVRLKRMTEAISDSDAGYAFVKAIDYSNKLNNKIFNLGGGDSTKAYYGKILAGVLKYYGLSLKYLFNVFFIDKNFYTHVYSDSDNLNKILEYRSDSLDSYFMQLRRKSSGRVIQRLLAKPLSYILNKRYK